MEPITSVRNPRVRDAAALTRRRERRTTGRHLVEGPNAVGEALAAGVVEEVFVTRRLVDELAVSDGVALHLVEDHVLERLADAATPQGVVAVARTATAALDEVVGHGVLVVLHEIADPGNAGTILRTADAAGADAVVFTAGSVDPFGPKAVRAAVGSTYHLPLVTDVALDEVAAACRTSGQPLLGLDAAGPRSVFDLSEAAVPLALVLGNEAHGLPDTAAARLDDVVAIPRWGRAESLNVAAAAAIAIYAAARAVHAPPHPSTPR
ncbi:TrmH family RNA methyltransferase [Egicoccus halophilus]|uniref:rRNA methyltransferase n=1 Tax=Egicoccus halophilus TaxID=1670830 RepID=A0A8J3EYA4_9ACTN|nr:RNA methyltransferase [Egicoccus halophilus]GGI07482.1 rRNA methyltransferase [Egicoccus halophilus]